MVLSNTSREVASAYSARTGSRLAACLMGNEYII